METLKQGFSKDSKHVGKPGNRLLYLINNAQSATLHVSESGPGLRSNECSLSGLGKFPILVSTILPDRQNLKNSERKTNTKSNSDSAIIARPVLVLGTADNDHIRTNLPLSTKRITKEPHEGTINNMSTL